MDTYNGYLSVNSFISEQDEANRNFIELRDYLLSKKIVLDTGQGEHKKFDQIEVAKTYIFFYSDNIDKITIFPVDSKEVQAMNNFSKAIRRPEGTIFHIHENNSFQFGSIFFDRTLIFIKLNSNDKSIPIDYPHSFYDIEGKISVYGDALVSQIQHSGIDVHKGNFNPSQSEIDSNIKKNRLSKNEFPVFPNGDLLLPGSKVLGGRGFYYDAEGVVLDVERVDNTGNIWTDWAIYCGFYELGAWVEVKGLLDWVSIIEFAKPLVSGLLPSKSLIELAKPDIKIVDSEIMELISKRPNILNDLGPEAFEDLICRMYEKRNFKVDKIGNWNQGDNGVDIIAVKKDFEIGTFRVAIQCKTSKNTIRPSVLRELNGSIDRFKADIGVVATSSSFSSNSIEETENFYWRIKIEDRNRIIDRLKEIFE